MSTARIIEFDEDDQVVCSICHSPIVDVDEGLVSQPSCPHILFVYANECFEWAEPGLEERLIAEEEEADQNGNLFEIWDALRAQCGKQDVILEQNDESMACGPVSFKVWVGIRREPLDSRSRCLHLVTAADDE